MKTVLTIAGFDPSSGAGITADLMVFAAHGLNGTSAITALTVQSTRGVRSTHPVDAAVLRDTLNHLDEDLPPAGIKIGMLATAGNVEVVCDCLESLAGHNIPVVLDPVLRSSSGRELLDLRGQELLRTRLLGLVTWITPNFDELAILTGHSVLDPKSAIDAAKFLQTSTAKGDSLNIVVTGGHLNPPKDLLLTSDNQQLSISGRHIQTRATHGTGCAFSSALLSQIVLGEPPASAARAAKLYVEGAMQHAHLTGSGPCAMNHLWQLQTPSTPS